MNQDKVSDIDNIAEYQPPEWVLSILTLFESSTAENAKSDKTPIDEMFTKRCAGAAELALNLAKLRQERQRVGFVPLSATDYIRRLIELVDIPESPILSWLQSEDFSLDDPKSANAFARLAQRVGISLREALVHLRISFAAQRGSPVPILLARTRSSSPHLTPIESSEVLLREIESGYDVADLRQLRAIEQELTASYE
ncbi:MAG TPA: hypothetical protein VK582_06460 [Pyrinomonadaceae bacterium]|nr:hypothetical protein [Pyrinomonadaceae bacterium]